MTGQLSQLIALTAYGNDYLKNGKIKAGFDVANRAFHYCNKVEFLTNRKIFFFSKPKESLIANSPSEWFKYLKADGCKYLRLYFRHSEDQSLAKDHKLAGFVGGGGIWLIEAVYDDYSNYWANNWTVTKRDDPDQKIWTVRFMRVAKLEPICDIQLDNQKVKERLRETLIQITGFAYKMNLNYWGDLFGKAKTIIDSPSPEENDYYGQLVPIGNYTLTSKQILCSAAASWVFGGMGSWNDFGFDNKEDNAIYEVLSEQLYSDVIDAIVGATNSY